MAVPTFECPYWTCVWPVCRKTPSGWETHPACRSAETAAIRAATPKEAVPTCKAAQPSDTLEER